MIQYVIDPAYSAVTGLPNEDAAASYIAEHPSAAIVDAARIDPKIRAHFCNQYNDVDV